LLTFIDLLEILLDKILPQLVIRPALLEKERDIEIYV